MDEEQWSSSLSGHYGDSHFRFNGEISKLISYIHNRSAPLGITADLFSETFNLQQIINSVAADSKTERGIIFPEKMNLHVRYSFSQFQKDRFQANNLRGILHYNSPMLVIDSLFMQTLDGTVNGQVALFQDKEKEIHTTVSANLYKIDIQHLFYVFNNFGQSQITDRHLMGNLSGDSDFSATFDDHFKIISSSIVNTSEVVIRDGELKNFEPIMALSKYIDVRELEDIQFSALQNTVMIKDRQVIIPQMDIRSNALDLSASGVHNFNKEYEYRVRLLLSELLYQKARKGRDEHLNISRDEDDTLTLFLLIYNEGKNVKVEYDREKAAEKIREDLQQEKDDLKQILNDELGIFKNQINTVEPDKQKSKDEPKFRFEFDDAPVNPDTLDNKDHESI
jgi:hypothetical protein